MSNKLRDIFDEGWLENSIMFKIAYKNIISTSFKKKQCYSCISCLDVEPSDGISDPVYKCAVSGDILKAVFDGSGCNNWAKRYDIPESLE